MTEYRNERNAAEYWMVEELARDVLTNTNSRWEQTKNFKEYDDEFFLGLIAIIPYMEMKCLQSLKRMFKEEFPVGAFTCYPSNMTNYYTFSS